MALRRAGFPIQSSGVEYYTRSERLWSKIRITPETASPANARFGAVRIAVAILVTAIGILTGIVAARHFLSLFSGPGPVRDVAAFGFPTSATAAIGCVSCALGIARGRKATAIA
jgi:hypothetical protein